MLLKQGFCGHICPGNAASSTQPSYLEVDLQSSPRLAETAEHIASSKEAPQEGVCPRVFNLVRSK